MQYVKIVSKLFRIIIKSIMIILLLCFMFSMWWSYIYGRQRICKLGENQYVTVWKRLGGDCFIMPYKYCGLTLPEKNFIVADNVGTVTIYFKDSTLLIYNGSSVEKIKGIYLPDYKYEYFDYPRFDETPTGAVLDSLDAFKQRREERVKNFSRISISVREPLIYSHPQ